MKSKLSFFNVVAFFLLAACNSDEKNKTFSHSTVSDSTVVRIANEAYIYGLPLVLMDITRRQMTTVPSDPTFSPPNQFRNNNYFPDDSFKSVIRPNADTFYSVAWLDLENEPVVLSLPNTKGRYYLMPMLDMYTNVFAALGSRTTGTDAIIFLITGSLWKGEVPKGMKQIKAPTNSVWIIGRTQVNSKEDGEKVVVPIQNQFKITPLSKLNYSYTADQVIEDESTPKGDPNSIVKSMSANDYFNYLNSLLAKYPPPVADKEILEQFETIDIGTGKKFNISQFSNNAQESINQLPTLVAKGLIKNYQSTDKNLVNGWNIGRKIIGSYGTAYKDRAEVAYVGLGANLREDAIYPTCFIDIDGKPLKGDNKYVMHFEKGQTPPTNAFWSLTMYDTEGFFIANPINRFAIGDRSNLKVNANGSIDIYIQNENPSTENLSNWLPAPKGDFNLLLRVYWPKLEMLNNDWVPPTVEKIN